MRKLEPKPLSRLLGSRNNSSHRLVEQGRLLQGMTRWLQQQLPLPLSLHCQVANIRENTLVLAADSSAWSSKLRFFSNNLLIKLKKERNISLRKVDIIVVPRAADKPVKQRQRSAISGSSADLLMQCAENETDPALKSALKRLASRSKSS